MSWHSGVGDIQAYLKDCVASYRNVWQSEWIPRYDTWKQMLESTRVHRIARPGSARVVQSLDTQIEQARSQIVSVWARSVTVSTITRYLTAEPVWRVETDDDAGNETLAEALSPYLRGLFLALDRDVVDDHLGFSWDHLVKASMVQFGKVIARPGIVRDGEYIRPVCPIIDPSMFYHDIGPSLPCHFIYEEQLAIRAIRAQLLKFGLTMPGKYADSPPGELLTFTHVFIDDIEDGKPKLYEAVLVNNEPIVWHAGTDQEDYASENAHYDRAPYEIVSMPPGPFPLLTGKGAVANHAEPLYAPGQRIVEQLEGLESLKADAAALAATPPVQVERDAGNKEDVSLHPGGVSETKMNEVKIHTIETTSPREFIAESSIASFRDQLDAIFPMDLIRALAKPGDSALLYNNQIKEAEKALAPLTMAVTTVKQRIARRLLDMARRDGGAMRVRRRLGDEAGAEREGKTRLAMLKPDMLPTEFELNVEEPIEFPKDALAQAQVAQQLKALGMFPDEAILRMVYKDPQPRRSLEKARQQRVADHPALLARDSLNKLRDELAAAKARYALAETKAERIRWSNTIFTIESDIEPLEASLLNRQSPRAQPDPMGLAPAQQSLEDKGGNALTDMRTNGRAPVPVPSVNGGGGA